MTEAANQDMRIVVIPAKSREEIQKAKRLKVAAYCRVSTDQEKQESSYEAQIGYYTEKIKATPHNPEKGKGDLVCQIKLRLFINMQT